MDRFDRKNGKYMERLGHILKRKREGKRGQREGGRVPTKDWEPL